VLRPGGMLGIMDVENSFCYNQPDFCPLVNNYPHKVYQEKLEGAGFRDVEMVDISQDVVLFRNAAWKELGLKWGDWEYARYYLVTARKSV
jgi:hypothetical protein